MKNRSKRFWRD